MNPVPRCWTSWDSGGIGWAGCGCFAALLNVNLRCAEEGLSGCRRSPGGCGPSRGQWAISWRTWRWFPPLGRWLPEARETEGGNYTRLNMWWYMAGVQNEMVARNTARKNDTVRKCVSSTHLLQSSAGSVTAAISPGGGKRQQVRWRWAWWLQRNLQQNQEPYSTNGSVLSFMHKLGGRGSGG